MLGKTVGWWVAMVAALSASSATTGCNAILGWDVPAEGYPPSCANIEGMCGVGEATGDCCASPLVPGKAGDSCAASVPGISLDAYEVTVARFQAYLDAMGNNKLYEDSIAGCENATFSASENQNLPIDCVTWQDAYDFCVWDEGRLPTVEEFRWAAGGIDGQEFPWKGPFNRDNAVVQSGGPQNVGTKVAGALSLKQYDLVGNVAEWTMLPLRCGQTAEFKDGGQECFGGSFATPESEFNGGGIPDAPVIALDTRDRTVGFRCARLP